MLPPTIAAGAELRTVGLKSNLRNMKTNFQTQSKSVTVEEIIQQYRELKEEIGCGNLPVDINLYYCYGRLRRTTQAPHLLVLRYLCKYTEELRFPTNTSTVSVLNRQ